MTIYIDNDYKCYVSEADGLRAFEVPFFDGKCPVLIEGYRYVPEGESWVRPDGVVFNGEMICPWKPYHQLATAQALHEISVREQALAELGVTADD